MLLFSALLTIVDHMYSTLKKGLDCIPLFSFSAGKFFLFKCLETKNVSTTLLSARTMLTHCWPPIDWNLLGLASTLLRSELTKPQQIFSTSAKLSSKSALICFIREGQDKYNKKLVRIIPNRTILCIPCGNAKNNCLVHANWKHLWNLNKKKMTKIFNKERARFEHTTPGLWDQCAHHYSTKTELLKSQNSLNINI